MRGADELLYLTQDGLLEPLMHSQVVRVVERLAALGWRYRIVSLEKERDLADASRVRRLKARLERAGVQWEFAPFDWAQSSRAAATNLGFLASRALELARAGRVRGIHARAYVPAVAALAAWHATGVRWVFDARGYWVDERLEEGRWFTTPLRLAVARGVEHQLFATASAVVTLTELQARDIEQRFRPLGARPVRCITTLADYDDFAKRPNSDVPLVPPEHRARLAGKLVIAVVGSINNSYLVDESLELARRILERTPAAHLLVLSGQHEEYRRRLGVAGVSEQRFTLVRAEHDAMPQWLSLVHWCLLLLQPNSKAKRASMPTKLGELFASGVRPIQFGCNDEVSGWVHRAETGLVLTDVSSAGLEVAARAVAEAAPLSPEAIHRARQRTSPHFSLEAGCARYDALLAEVFGR
ncbi:MAG: glycosyltransferase [Myxococcaceae bacterium]|nr:glycosyltransferase [Myxococcaceae bacterium]MCA3012332.1 glycosyltransferase [Myxococcaceae bacterium]